jgi:hypothetical protein
LDAFWVERVYVSGDPQGTLTFNSFVRGVRLRTRESQNTQLPSLQFRALLTEHNDGRVQLHIG